MRILKVTLGILLVTTSLVIGMYLFSPLKVNWHTASLPRGVYLKADVTDAIEYGDYAATCLNNEQIAFGIERGYLPAFPSRDCNHGLYPAGKAVYGKQGDIITFSDAGNIIINGDILPIKRLEHDFQGRVMPLLPKPRYELGEGEYWLMSAFKANSWDSRYWGPVSIEYQLKPLWIW